MKRATLALVLLVVGCGHEIGRVALKGEGQGEATMTLAAGDVAFWTDLDIKYEGDAALAYQIDLLQDGAVVGSAACNPLGTIHVKTMWVETNLNGKHSRSGEGKMSCGATLAKAGPTTVRTTLAFAQKPATVTLAKADLVVKQ